MNGRLSTLGAAWVVARRDFTAVLLSRSFIFFLLGPLFPVVVAALAGGIGRSVEHEAARAELGIAMAPRHVDAMLAAREAIAPRAGGGIPQFTVVRRLRPGESFDAATALKRSNGLAALVTGTPEAPVLTGPPERIAQWQGPVSLVSAQALGRAPQRYPEVRLSEVPADKVELRKDRLLTAQAGQTLLFLLTMLLAGMVLSNLVEEKANKIIEILAAAIPLDALFLGKLFAMLAVSLVGIAVWGLAGGAIALAAGNATLVTLAAPAVGWPAFLLLGIVYFAMAYLLIGSVFLAIGSLASTVREVQTLSLPATMLHLIVFFIASFAMARPGSAIELAAVAIPFSSPFAMLARAARDPALWPHVAAITWQVLSVGLLVRAGAALFRRRVMKSGPARSRRRKLGPLLRGVRLGRA